MTTTPARRWDRYPVHIRPNGAVSLRKQSGRTVVWGPITDDPARPDILAAELLSTYPGSTLVDKRKAK